MNKKYLQSVLKTSAVLGAGVIASVLFFSLVRHLLIKDNEALIHSVAQRLSTALLMGDTQQVDATLKSLQQYPGVEAAELVNADGATIAAYDRHGRGDPMSSFELASVDDDATQLHLTAPITFDSLVIAHLHLTVNLWPVYLRIITALGVLLIFSSAIYVIFKQQRIKIRFETINRHDDASGQDDAPFDLASAVDVALKNADISLSYQSIHNLLDGGLYGMEVVVCWRHPSGQTLYLSPADLLNMAKRSDIELPFEDWLLTQAISQASDWQDQFGPLVLSLNIGADQFHDSDFAQRVLEICEQTQYSTQRLELIVHESVVGLNLPQSAASLQMFAALGLGVTVDRFGLVRRSLDLFSELPVQKIRLDRNLIKRLDRDAQVAQLINDTVLHACAHDIQVMADGVEQGSQRTQLLQMGCTLGQGAYFSVPISAVSFATFLAARPFDTARWPLSEVSAI